jgi:hypothetical protein
MRDKLKQILESVDPAGEVFTEAAQTQFVELIEARVNEKVETAIAEQKTLHEAELVKIDEDHAEKLEQVLEHIDADHTAKLEQILEHIDADHSEKLEQVLEHIDADHTAKLEQVLEHIDADHSEKLEQVLEHIDADHTDKLQDIIDHYEAKLEEGVEAPEVDEALVENVSDYLDHFIEESVPAGNIVNEARLQKLETVISEMRKTLLVTDEYVETEIAEAVEDAKTQIDDKTEELNSALNENIELKKQIKTLEAQSLLESKVTGFTESKKLYITKLFEGSSANEISQKLDEAVKAYDNELNEKRRLIKEEKINKVKHYYNETPVLESTNPEMDSYVNTIKNSYGPSL